MRNQRGEFDFGLDHYIAVAAGDLRVGGPSAQGRCPSDPFGLWPQRSSNHRPMRTRERITAVVGVTAIIGWVCAVLTHVDSLIS